MSLNLDRVGATLAVIKDDPKMKNKIVSVATDNLGDDDMKTYQSIKLQTGKFQPIGDWNRERSVGYIVGASGSGKSFFICEWVKEYKKKFKRNPVYLFSSLDEDESLEPINPQRIILDNDFLNEEIDLTMYKDSCVIFDDCDTISNKKIKERVYTLMNMMLNTGRHFNITIWCVNHTATGTKMESKIILNEAHYIVYFPVNQNRQLVYMLENYCGIDKKQMTYLKNLGSRWVCIYKHFPQVCITEKQMFLLNQLSKDD
jgi:hypothetical protein